MISTIGNGNFFLTDLGFSLSVSLSIYEEGSKTISCQDTKAFIPVCLPVFLSNTQGIH